MKKNLLSRSDLRVAVIDIEASALGKGSYPIEVGFALIGPVPQPIQTWSTLIRPAAGWLENGRWSPGSEAIHGIPKSLILKGGLEPSKVCDALNSHLEAQLFVVSDAPRFDQDWLDTLFQAGKREQLFRLYDFDQLKGDLNADQHRQLRYMLSRDMPPHRAEGDARRLAGCLMEVHLGYPPRVISKTGRVA